MDRKLRLAALVAVLAVAGCEPPPVEPPAVAAPRSVLIIDFIGQEVRDQVGGEYFIERASEGGVLLLITYKVINDGDLPVAAYDVPQIRLYDAAGVAYASDLGKTAAYATEDDAAIDTKVISDINPGITTRGAEVFEISRTAFAAGGWSVGVEGQPVADRVQIELTP